MRLSLAFTTMAGAAPPGATQPKTLCALAGRAATELTQTLGFMPDVKSPAYVGVSVPSQDGNRITNLGAQDKASLRQHYPPK
ncbi:hypothetical protein [Lentibacter sp. XHP0401]|uniref:hypothetical protein n=1 Tax=Lentibacter sp. XHP0401 TaxID=2984334 RepID=UPI0021E93EA4|nr:hypothetical protein [Lentibacter sp. XHP0401]MCV2893024.1 hypothetical protein [Lentibacter sp. XHP0401]